jgi:hypothetical protein
MLKTKLDINQTPFFFILGRPRSGTTLLSTILDAHLNIIVPFESSIIINLHSKYGKITKWNKDILAEFYHDLSQQRKFEGWPMKREVLKADILNSPENVTYQELIKTIYLHFKSYYEKEEIEIIGDKNPIYSFYGKKLLEIFPEAKIIHIIRDYRDNILSIKKVNFEAPVTALLAHRWKIANKKIEKLSKKYPNQYYLLKYEELVSDSEQEIKKICTFLNVSFQESMLNFHQAKDKVLKDFSKKEIDKYHSSLYQPINTRKVGIWKKKMRERNVKIADSINQLYAEKYGYEPRYTISLSSLIISLPWIIYSHFSLINRKIVDHLPFKMKNRIRNKGPILAFLFNKLYRRK